MIRHDVVEIALWLLGLCIGSFLNVVVYRLPAGLSIARPRRSFCPQCKAAIAWYDNLPLLSWLLLRARCRHCATPISLQYPLVEGITGLGFVLVYHLLFVVHARAGLPAAQLPTDLPLLLAWLVLLSALIACSAMDLTSYMVDVRVTNTVVYAALIFYACWPRLECTRVVAESTAAGTALAAFVVTAFMLWWTVWRVEPPAEPLPAETSPAPAAAPGAAWVGAIVVLLLTLLAGALVYAGVDPESRVSQYALAAGLLALFAAVVVIGGQQRPVDQELHEAIEEERHSARRVALRELCWLLPIICAAAGVIVLFARVPAWAATWRSGLGWTPIAGFAPAAGVLCVMLGAMVAAAAGWALRIVFTLAYGREAFGIGDIYILAAAGAAGGWDIALAGLVLSVGIALVGWLLGLLLKSTALIPFGPWLGLGFLVALWWNRATVRLIDAYRDNFSYAWQERPHVLLIICGLMLVGIAVAFIVARLVRRWVAPES
jgi:leader peptidase (prepilin peptidase) / N-methyltransferase